MEAVFISREIETFDFSKLKLTEFISGGASAHDKRLEKHCADNRIPTFEIRPDHTQGRWAPLVRNREVIAGADKVYAVWDGISKGTKEVIRLALQKGTPLEIFIINAHGEMHLTDTGAIRQYLGAFKKPKQKHHR